MIKYAIGAIVGALLIVGIYLKSFFAYDPVFSLKNLTANGTFVVPAGYYISDVVIENTTANAITGGIKIGTTSGAIDVVTGQTVGANALVNIGTQVLKKQFSTSSDQTLFVQAVTAFNSANLNVYFIMFKLK